MTSGPRNITNQYRAIRKSSKARGVVEKRCGANESVDVIGLGQSGNERPARLVLPVQSRCEGRHCTGHRAVSLIFLPVTPVPGPGLKLRDMV